MGWQLHLGEGNQTGLLMQLLKTVPLGAVILSLFFYHLYLPFQRLSLLGTARGEKKKREKERNMFP